MFRNRLTAYLGPTTTLRTFDPSAWASPPTHLAAPTARKSPPGFAPLPAGFAAAPSLYQQAHQAALAELRERLLRLLQSRADLRFD